MARKRIEPTREYGGPDELLAWSKESTDQLESHRYLALRMLMLGESRETVMKAFDLSWSTLQKWVRLWNKGGREAVRVGTATGRPPIMTPEGKDFLVKTIEFNHSKTGERITAIAISGRLKKKYRDIVKERCDLLLASQTGLPLEEGEKHSDSER